MNTRFGFFSKYKWFFLSLFLLLVLVHGISYKGKVLPGVFLGDMPFSGKDNGELKEVLKRTFSDRDASVFIDGGAGRRELRFSYSELGVVYDVDATADNLYETGRTNSMLKNAIFRAKAFFVKTNVKPVYSVDSSKFAAVIEGALAEDIYAASDATVEVGVDSRVIPEVKGNTYDRQALVGQLRDNVENLRDYPVTVSFVEIEPKVKADGSKKALEKVKTLSNQRIALLFGRESWVLRGRDLLSSLRFVPGDLEDREFALVVGEGQISSSFKAIGTDGASDLEVTLDQAFLDDFIGEIKGSIDVETVDASLVFDGKKVSEFTPARDGQELDFELTKKLVLEKVSTDNVSGEEQIAIQLPVDLTRARIASEEINSLGIKELVGRGISYFAGSIPNRIYNLSLGSQRISGTIVKPGETFSFNQSVGEVSGASGYRPAYVISGGRTVLDDGGGMCQVSTTVFRAALDAGLPILKRTAHAYRVGYYEQRGFGAGLDATVWSPAVDLVFKNDTDHHVLVQAVVDTVNARLQVDIYGTSDGRKVEMTDPVVSNVIPAPEPRYQDDPTLAKGTTKQVDFAASGATSVFTRKVYRGDELVIDDVFRSVYRPWQAVYLVGTGG